MAPRPRTPATAMTMRYVLPGVGAGVVALAALVAGSAFGSIHGHSLDTRLVAWISAGVLLVAGAFATARLSAHLGQLVAHRSLPSAGGAVRIVTAAIGYLFVAFSLLALLQVSIARILVGAGLAGIVLGIAATQSLGNVFAGMVLILSRPFAVGDHVRIRSGSLGGVFDAWVVEMTLTYTTLRLDDGRWKIPNSAMLAAGVGQLPRTGAAPPLPQVPAAPPATGPSPPATGPLPPTTGPSPSPPAAAVPAATVPPPAGPGAAPDVPGPPTVAIPETVPRRTRRRGARGS